MLWGEIRKRKVYLNLMVISDIHVLYVGLFTQQGAMADDYVQLGKYLAERCSVFCIMGQSEKYYEVPGAKDIMRLTISRHNKEAILDIRNYINIWRYVRANKIDVIFFKTPHPANIIISIMLKKYLQVTYCHDFKEHVGVNRFINFITSLEKKVQAHNSRKLFVASESLKCRMIREKKFWSEDKIEVIPLGVMENLVSGKRCDIEDIDVLFFGRIEFYKGLDVLSAAVAGEKWNVYVVGKGDLMNVYGFAQFPPNVTFLNEYVDDPILADLIGRSKIIVLPYREATGTQVIPTAMYCGKAIIATDVGSFGEYIRSGEDGVIIPPENVDSLRSAISEVLAKDEFRAKLSTNAAVKANKKFTNSRIADLYIQNFDDIVLAYEGDGT